MKIKSAKKLLKNTPVEPDQKWFDQTLAQIQVLSGKQQKSKFNFLQMLFMKNKIKYVFLLFPVFLLMLASLTVVFVNKPNSNSSGLTAEEEKSLLQKIWNSNEFQLVSSVSAADLDSVELNSSYIYKTTSQATRGPKFCIEGLDEDPLNDLYKKVISESYYYETDTKMYSMKVERIGDEIVSLSSFLTDYDTQKLRQYEYKGGEYAVKGEHDLQDFKKPTDVNPSENNIDNILENNFDSTAKIIKQEKENGKNYYLIQTQGEQQDLCSGSEDYMKSFWVYWVNTETLSLYKSENYVKETNRDNLVITNTTDVIKIDATDENVEQTFILESKGIKIILNSESTNIYNSNQSTLDYIKNSLLYLYLPSDLFEVKGIFSIKAIIPKSGDSDSMWPSYYKDRSFFSPTEFGQSFYDSYKSSSLTDSYAEGAAEYSVNFTHESFQNIFFDLSVYSPKSSEMKQSLIDNYSDPRSYIRNADYRTKEIDISIGVQKFKTNVTLVTSDDNSFQITNETGGFAQTSQNISTIVSFFEFDRFVFVLTTTSTSEAVEHYENLFNNLHEITFRKVDSNSEELKSLAQ